MVINGYYFEDTSKIYFSDDIFHSRLRVNCVILVGILKSGMLTMIRDNV